MPAASVPGAKLAAEKLRWGKYSAIYQRRLLEGGRSFEAFLVEAGLDWNVVKQEKARKIDEILDQFIKQKHSENKKSSLRLAKHAVLMVQIARPRLRRCLQTAWNSVKAWEEQRPSNFRPPIPIPLLVLWCAELESSHIAVKAQTGSCGTSSAPSCWSDSLAF